MSRGQERAESTKGTGKRGEEGRKRGRQERGTKRRRKGGKQEKWKEGREEKEEERGQAGRPLAGSSPHPHLSPLGKSEAPPLSLLQVTL